MKQNEERAKIDATKQKCHRCGQPAHQFLFIIFKPTLCDKPFCKKCIKDIKKECGL